MLPFVLSIVLVVLMSAAVLWVVDGEQTKPTSARPDPNPVPVAPAPARSRRPATSRRRPAPIPAPAPLVQTRIAPGAVPPRASALTAVQLPGAPLARRRIRSSALLVVLVVSVGVIVAVVIGAIVTALAFALRAAVTS